MKHSCVIDDANTLMTKTGVAVTVIFVLTIGYDIIYYTLGKTGLAVYIINSPVQMIGLLLSAFNSVANPFVYVLLMPAFRDSLRKTFHLPRSDTMANNAIAEGSNSATSGSDTASGRGGQSAGTASDRVMASPRAASPNDLQVEMTSVTSNAGPSHIINVTVA